MRKTRGGKARQLDVADLVELVGALSNIRNGGNGHTESKPDPTVNVKEQLLAATGRIDDMAELREKYEEKLRGQDKDWQVRFDNERRRAEEAARLQEAGRIDSKIGDIVQAAVLNNERLTNAATILATTVATTADTAQKAVVAAAQQQSELVGQVRDTVTVLQGVVTTFIATGGGERTAKSEQLADTRWTQRQASQRSEWFTGLLIGGGIAGAGLIVGVATFLSSHIK